jgi:hypothetical protein
MARLILSAIPKPTDPIAREKRREHLSNPHSLIFRNANSSPILVRPNRFASSSVDNAIGENASRRVRCLRLRNIRNRWTILAQGFQKRIGPGQHAANVGVD